MRQLHFKKGNLIMSLVLLWAMIACDNRRPPSELVYQGDVLVMRDIDGFYSEKGKKVLKVKSPYQATLQNEDRKYPEGLYLEFFEKGEKLATIIHSDSAYYQKSADKWYLERNVHVKNVETNEVLTTDEMIWDRITKKIIIDTSKVVTINTPDKVVKGKGLVANENFTDWEMHNVTGIFYPADEID